MPPDPRFSQTTAVNDPDWAWSPAVYEYLLRLNRDTPSAFEAERQRILDDVIQRAGSNAGRLRRLQWRIDQERRRARTPLQSCLRLQTMMWACFQDLDRALQSFTGAAARTGHEQRDRKIASVLHILRPDHSASAFKNEPTMDS